MLRFRSAIILFFIFLLWGCRSKPAAESEPDTMAIISIETGPHMNATGSEQAAPLQSRLYELTDKTLFEQADFIDIFLNDTAALQSTLIKKHTLPTILPATRVNLTFKLDSSTRYVAFLAEFAQYHTAQAKDIQPVSAGNDNLYLVQIDENRLRMTLARPREPATNGK